MISNISAPMADNTMDSIILLLSASYNFAVLELLENPLDTRPTSLLINTIKMALYKLEIHLLTSSSLKVSSDSKKNLNLVLIALESRSTRVTCSDEKELNSLDTLCLEPVTDIESSKLINQLLDIIYSRDVTGTSTLVSCSIHYLIVYQLPYLA